MEIALSLNRIKKAHKTPKLVKEDSKYLHWKSHQKVKANKLMKELQTNHKKVWCCNLQS